jgi:hypothetical protein
MTALLLALPRYSRLPAYADGCRAAALAFLNEVAAARPSPSHPAAQLAQWLRGAYDAHVVALSASHTARLGAAGVVPSALERLLSQARLEVGLGLLRAHDPEGGVSFAYSAIAAALVYRCKDAAGAPGWVAVAQPRMRLADRVLSLVAADYLLRPEDYETGLYTCAACGKVDIDATQAAAGVCAAHADGLRSALAS